MRFLHSILYIEQEKTLDVDIESFWLVLSFEEFWNFFDLVFYKKENINTFSPSNVTIQTIIMFTWCCNYTLCAEIIKKVFFSHRKIAVDILLPSYVVCNTSHQPTISKINLHKWYVQLETFMFLIKIAYSLQKLFYRKTGNFWPQIRQNLKSTQKKLLSAYTQNCSESNASGWFAATKNVQSNWLWLQ